MRQPPRSQPCAPLLLLRPAAGVVSLCAWYSTDSAVICMNASSSEACWGLSSCSTIPCCAASSPSVLGLAAVHLQRPVAALDGDDPGLVQHVAQPLPLRGAHPDVTA